ncbi:hypothetical protein BCV69DRAFT_279944 [Microstroma glucosiphilum]|uniref:P-loop containing nucleoside triphosphate hydrolase protein n=1 Tax=Pseudomicrostroma glucosiphilum TaxID=1684307 RepID=A0A316UFL9_9BASI|nr:hypothetical protein BCV69DRAFT_279944 [Pseudomicrostroma glucosiphilum]PWN24039.1 hypothetical protein BCV69DRAFT_279944 [Pseudomicrostroma glucosiphilum]
MVQPASTWAKAIGSQAHPGVPTRSAAQTTFDSIPAEGHLLQDILPGHTLLQPLRDYGIVDTADIAYEFGLTAEYMNRQGNPSAAVTRAALLMPPTSPVELARFLQEVQRRLSFERSIPPPSSMHSLSHHTQTLLKGILPSSTASPRRELKPLPPPPLPSAESQELQRGGTPLASRASTPSERSRYGTTITAPSSPAEQSELAVVTEPVAPLPPLPPAAPMLSGLKALDDCFADEIGLPPGRALEIIGPTASGKSRFGLQLIVENRVAGLRMNRQRKAGVEPPECAREGPEQEESQSREGFDEVLIIDTEGSLTPDIIEETVWQRVELLKLTDPESTALFREVLDGMHLVIPASLAELIATIRVLTASPTPARSDQSKQDSELPGSLPPLRSLSAILLDTLSFHLRTPVETTPERRGRRHALSLLSSLLPLLSAQNPRLRLVATGQMSLKMFSRAGDLVTYRTPGSIARMVPQVEAPGGTGATGGAGGEYVSGMEKGPGVLGEGAWRILLFRLGERRMAQLFYSPPLPLSKKEDEASEGGQGEDSSGMVRGSQMKRRRIGAHADGGRWIPFRIDTRGRVVEE